MSAAPVAGHAVAHVPAARWDEVSRTLAAAFADDPVFGWLLPDAATRLARLRRFFAIEARDIALGHGESLAGRADGGAGAALVLPPGRWRTPLRAQAANALGYARIFGAGLPRAFGVLTLMERRHPRRPHWYFPYIGVAPGAQGAGLGTAMMTPVLERCDRDGIPAYLEASNPRCARLYERLGFVTVRQIRPLGAPPIALMAREPA